MNNKIQIELTLEQVSTVERVLAWNRTTLHGRDNTDAIEMHRLFLQVYTDNLHVESNRRHQFWDMVQDGLITKETGDKNE